jgi:hypothetical protein
MSNEIEVQNLNVVSGDALQQIQKVEIDTAIATAKQYPRDLTSFKDMSTMMATLDEDTAMSCIYKRPVGGGKFAEGMSIRTAEIVAACYGNLKVQARIIEQTERRVVCEGIAHDLQTNNLQSVQQVETTVQKNGNPYSENMRNVVAKACLAKARRDAIFAVVPRAMCKHIENSVRDLLFGNAESINARKEKLYKWIKTMPIHEDRVWNALKIGGIDDVTPKTLETLVGLYTAIKNNDITIDEAFPAIEVKPQQRDATDVKHVDIENI